ncbi:MAG: stage III sporulation protein AE [Clostridium sp.]
MKHSPLAVIAATLLGIAVTLFWQTPWSVVLAAEENNLTYESDDLLAEFNFDKIQNFLDQTSEPGITSLSFKELLAELMQGNFTGVFGQCLSVLKENLLGEIQKNGIWMSRVMILGLIGAVFSNFSGIFSGSQISEIGFYVTYLLLFTFLASSFLTGIMITQEVLSSIVEFMRALIPTYFLAVSFSGGSITSAAGYGWMIASITGVEWLFSTCFLPMTRVYVLFVLAGHMMKENIFSRMTDLIELGIRWGLKTAAGIVLGFHFLQSMVTPYADSLKNTSLQRLIHIVPGVGQGAAAISQLVLGSGVLIKNTIGAGAVIVLLLICVIPIVKLTVILFFYQAVAALLQPICDQRIVSCISAVGVGCQLLLRMVITSLLLFAISLAVVCMAANVTYYAG